MKPITRNEELILLSILHLKKNAYLIGIKNYLSQVMNKDLSITAIHIPLRRLEKSGYLESNFGEATAVRGGRRKKIYQLTESGIKELSNHKRVNDILWENFSDLTSTGYTGWPMINPPKTFERILRFISPDSEVEDISGDFMLKKDLGFDKDRKIVIEWARLIRSQLETFKAVLISYPEIQNVSNSHAVPGKTYSDIFFTVKNQTPEQQYNLSVDYLSVKFRSDEYASILNIVRKEWDKVSSWLPLKYHFLNDGYAKLYQSEQQSSELFTIFSILAVFIGCLGLFGLVSFSAEKRTKEIGIRKVVGASQTELFIMLSKDFIKLVLFSFVLVSPFTYYGITKWLEVYAYRIDSFFPNYLFAGIIILAITMLTISYQVLKAANANPIDALMNE